MAQVRFHRRVLSTKQEKVLRELAPSLSRDGFYLGGGTALALLLGHRRSVDLDWFHPGPTGDPLMRVAGMRQTGLAPRVLSVARGTVHLMVRGVRVSLLEFGYPELRKPLQWEYAGCRLASLDDLACMKLAAVAQSGARKDVVDVYALLKKHGSLNRLLHLYQKKFRIKDIGPVLFGLSYHTDAEREPMPRMIWNVRWPVIKQAIEKELLRHSR